MCQLKVHVRSLQSAEQTTLLLSKVSRQIVRGFTEGLHDVIWRPQLETGVHLIVGGMLAPGRGAPWPLVIGGAPIAAGVKFAAADLTGGGAVWALAACCRGSWC